MGKRIVYTDELLPMILHYLGEGWSLHMSLSKSGVNPADVYRLCKKHPKLDAVRRFYTSRNEVRRILEAM